MSESESRAGLQRFPLRSRFNVSRFSEGQFLILLLLLFFTAPFVEDLPNGATIEAALLTVVLTSAVVAVGGRRRSLTIALLLALPTAVARWLHNYRPDAVPAWVFLGAALIFAGFVVVHHLWFILTAPEVDSRVLLAGISTYLMMGLLWSFAYVLVAQTVPDAFAFNTGPASDHVMNGFTAFYFSFVTLSSTGYGDITPVASVARMLAVMETMAGAFYLAILIARLVALHTLRTAG